MAVQHTMPVAERLSDITQRWFLTEPLLFGTFCTHELVAKEDLMIPMRTGKGRVEYCPALLEAMPDAELADRLKVEMLRIMLKHPYQRQPYRARPEILYMASNATINDAMGKKAFCFDLLPPEFVEALPKGLTFEEYYEFINRMIPPEPESESARITITFTSGDGETEASATFDVELQKASAELWDEDSLMEDCINAAIRVALSNMQGRGTLPADFIEIVKASLVPPLNVANILRRFKKTILSQRRNLTRMRPSRRYGFEQMGSRYAYTTRVLVALDVSGSVSSELLSKMLSMINRLFKQGVEQIDVVQFDAELKLPATPIRKAISTFKVVGRGGTDFQPAADYYIQHPEYDGLIYITDGIAPDPVIDAVHRHLPVTWLIADDQHLVPTIRHGWERKEYIINN